MESRVKLLGHPLHPILIPFPLGLLITSFIFDIVYLLTHNAIFSVVAFWMIAAGVIGGLIAAVPGMIDWLAIPPGTRARSIALWHLGSNVLAIVLFVLSWLIRIGAPPGQTGAVAIILSLLGVVVLGVGGWLGGELVDRLGVGVDEGAHLNAPSALSRRPAGEGSSTGMQREE
jgi:uncharacterized membrane protein